MTLLNGAGIKIFNILYFKFTSWIVKWENHKYLSEQSNSLILKNFAFQLANSYTYICYLILFTDRSFEQLEKDLLILMATAFAIKISFTYGIPYLFFKLNKRQIVKKWKVYYEEFYKTYFQLKERQHQETERKKMEEAAKQKLLEMRMRRHRGDDYYDEAEDINPKKNEREVLLQEIIPEELVESKLTDYSARDHYLHQQVEYTRAMIDDVYADDAFSDLAINLGYATFFSVIAPTACLVSFAMNGTYIAFYVWKLTSITKRANPIPASNIGVWATIFKVAFRDIVHVLPFARRNTTSLLVPDLKVKSRNAVY